MGQGVSPQIFSALLGNNMFWRLSGSSASCPWISCRQTALFAPKELLVIFFAYFSTVRVVGQAKVTNALWPA